MSVKNFYSHPNFSVKQKIYSITDFRGVNYDTVENKVNPQNAVDISNYIRRDGVNQKRYGVEEIIACYPVKYHILKNGNYISKTNPVKVNGVWTFIAEDGKEHTVAHIGNILFEILNLDENAEVGQVQLFPLTQKIIEEEIVYLTLELENEKSNAFVGANRLYILGGNDFFLLRFLSDNQFILESLRESKEVFIPTTTIGITYKDSIVSGRSPLDDTNMLTQWRKNKLVSGVGVSEEEIRTTRFYEYELDTSVKPMSDNDLNELTIVIESLNKKEIENKGE
jgi:hypothetical protein